MKKLALHISLVIFLIGSIPLTALENRSPRKREPWYFSVSFGINSLLAQEFKRVDDSNAGITLDPIRYYIPVNDHLLLGGGIQISVIGRMDDELNVIGFHSASPAFSCQYYFRSIGDGIFVRSDLGFSRSAYNPSTSSEEKRDYGLSVLLAVGSAFVISNGDSSLLLFFSYQAHFFKENTFSFAGFSFGFLL